ncbi:Enoyl-CoA hydratase/carnithine racemase [Psychrobacillus sp. OK028]|uniref:enoyl-CoA hydratase/isomerase family protein n=1 Tax=Psychrobacillus sp. OK028 TaxID=1884359 RepID=UPI0008884A37|nr:enoyl-CoA hydratase/isomerase family protein [Psychrobacillus sp. OK028]SDM51105.1 Enoyl-CoA hydratase/carnithine racemase [Psychrobacillus sp. OK028]
MTYTLTKREEIIILEINRPNIHNAINMEVLEGFKELVHTVKKDSSIKLAVITGAGEKSFCSGGDLSVFHKLKTERESYDMLSETATILYDVATMTIPTLALVNGTAIGGGCEIATLCDYRLVKKEAKCGFIQGQLAITSGWGGGTYLWEKGMRQDYTLQMLTEATPYPSDKLQAIGWATEVFEGNKYNALELFIDKMIVPHETVLRAYKMQLVRKWEQSKLFERIMEEVRTCSVLWAQDAHHQAVDAFLSKKK